MSKYTLVYLQMAARQTQRRPTLRSNESESADDQEGNQQDDATASPGPQTGPSEASQTLQLDANLELRLDELIQWKVQQQLELASKTGSKRDFAHGLSETDSDEASLRSQHSVGRCVPEKRGKKRRKRKSNVSTSSDSDLSEGDKYRRPKTKPKTKKKTKHKKSKKSKRSSSSESSESSFPSSDTDNKQDGVMERQLAKVGKKKRREPADSVRVRSLLRTALDAGFDTFKPAEVISQAREKYTGIKGVKESFLREMDSDVIMNDQMRRFETTLHTMQSAVLSAMAAIAPIANRMANEHRFTTLATTMNDGLEVLAAASSYATFKRYENVFKNVTTDAGKEVTRSKKIKDRAGKEYTLFMPPKPIPGKHWDKTQLYGGQIQHLIKKAESGTKNVKNMGIKHKTADYQPRSKRPRFEPPKRPYHKGSRGSYTQNAQNFRSRPQRGSGGWNDSNRPNFNYNKPTPHPRQQGFNRGGAR